MRAQNKVLFCFVIIVIASNAFASRKPPSPRPSPRLKFSPSPKPGPRPRPGPRRQTKYTLVIFGDSISDTGNDFQAAGVPDPAIYIGPGPYGSVTGRFSNGFVWVDYLNATLSKKNPIQIFNYAHGGATACQSTLMEAFAPFVKNLTAQMQLFLDDIKAGKVVLDTDTRLLVIQWIGSADVLIPLENAVATGSFPSIAVVANLTKSVVACRLANLQALATLTGIVTDIAVIPIAPLHISPVVPTDMLAHVVALEDFIGMSTVLALQRLQRSFSKAAPNTPGYGVKLHPIGTTAVWMANGVSKVKPPILYTNASCFVNPVSSLVITPGIKPCSNPSDYLFYDTQHCQTNFHKWVANKGLLPKLQALKLLP